MMPRGTCGARCVMADSGATSHEEYRGTHVQLLAHEDMLALRVEASTRTYAHARTQICIHALLVTHIINPTHAQLKP